MLEDLVQQTAKSHRKILVSLIFVDIEVKSNLHSNMTRAKPVFIRHSKLYLASSSSLSSKLHGDQDV